MIDIYFLIGGLVTASSIISSWMFISSKSSVWIKMFLSSVLMVVSLYIWLQLPQLFGFPVDEYPADGSQIVSFIIIDHTPKSIFLWTWNDKEPRAYRIPYSEGIKNELEAGSKQQGMIMYFHRGGKKEKGGKGTPGNGLGIHDPFAVWIDVKPALPPKGGNQ